MGRIMGIFCGIMLLNSLYLNSCSSMRAGLYLISIDDDNGESNLKNEPYVKKYLENIIDSYRNYSIKVFVRTVINFQFKRTKLLTHSYYVLFIDSEEYHTLSFYGTDMSFYSEGAWVLDADSDIKSYRMYLEGNNRWDVEEVYSEYIIDVRETLKNVINKIDSGITYYFRDHIKDKKNMDNCNTALYETVVLDGRREHY